MPHSPLSPHPLYWRSVQFAHHNNLDRYDCPPPDAWAVYARATFMKPELKGAGC